MSVKESWPHLVAGGVAGMVGAVVTSPLEVVKTRFQSSVASNMLTSLGDVRVQHQVVRYSRIWATLTQIVMQEGAQGLFRGLAPTLMGQSGVSKGSQLVVMIIIFRCGPQQSNIFLGILHS